MIHIIVLSLTVSLIQCIFLVFTVHSGHGPPSNSSYASTKSSQLLQMYLAPYFLSANNTYHRSISNRFFDTVNLSRIYCTFRSWPPPLTLPIRLQSLVNLYKCIQLTYFLSANNTYSLSISNRFFDTVYLSRIYCTFRSWPPPLTLPTRLQSLVNLYECNQLPYFLSANNTYCLSISNRFFDTVYFSRIYCTYRSLPPPLTLPTRLQSLINLYKSIPLPYFLSANNTYYRSISNRFFDTVYLSRIYCTFRSWPPSSNSSYASTKSSQPLRMYLASLLSIC